MLTTRQRSVLFRFASLFVVLAFLFGMTSPVRAEGETPAETPPPTTEGNPPTEGGEAAQEEITAAVEALDEANALLLDESGQALPLASEEAAELLTAPDPYFTCLLAKDTKDGTADGICRYTKIQDAVDDFTIRGGSGMITIDAGTFEEDVIVDGIANLTGLSGSGSDQKVNAAGQTTVRGYIAISNMSRGFYLGGMNIEDSSLNDNLTFTNIGGTLKIEDVVVTENSDVEPGGAGIVIEDSTAEVKLSEVLVHDLPGDGMRIDNSLGKGSVTLNNSAAVTNGGDGINVTTRGKVNFNGVTARWNFGDGGNLSKTYAVYLTNSVFDNNGGSGLKIVPGAAATSVNGKNVFASGNWQAGIWIELAAGNVSLENVVANGNGQNDGPSAATPESGLFIQTGGTVVLKNITANENDQYADNISAEEFHPGVKIHAGGPVSLTNITATGNGGDGLRVTFLAGKTASVSLARAQLSENGGHGLHILSRGTISLNAITAKSNDFAGARLDNTGGTAGITLLSSLGDSLFIDNAGEFIHPSDSDLDKTYAGLEIASNGPVTLSNVSARFNDQGGMHIQTKGAVTIKGSVTVVEGEKRFVSVFSGNEDYGLKITTPGAITLSGVDASMNGEVGMLLENPASLSPVSVTNARVNFNNGVNGLSIKTKGVITLKAVEVSANLNGGALLDNRSNQFRGVTIADKAWSHFDQNGGAGLTVLTYGPVVLGNLTAADNTTTPEGELLSGAYYGRPIGSLDTHRYTITLNDGDDVTISVSANFFGSINLLDSLESGVAGAEITAGDNTFQWDDLSAGQYYIEIDAGDEGAYTFGYAVNGGALGELVVPGGPGAVIDTRGSSLPVAVKITNATSPEAGGFSGNGGSGLLIYTNGPVNLTGVRASGNVGDGIFLLNPAVKPVSAKTLTVSSNFKSGMLIDSKGAVSLEQVVAEHNIENGAKVTTSGDVVVKGTRSSQSYFAFNQDGLVVVSPGRLTLSNMVFFMNEDDSLLLNNPTSLGAVTLNDVQGWYGYAGITVTTRGAITLNRVSWSNSHFNAVLDNSAGANTPVSITGSSFSDSLEAALTVTTRGAILLKDSGGSGNLGNGFELDNSSGTAGVSISGGTLSADPDGFGIGLQVRTNGAILVNGLTVEGFQRWGADLDNLASSLTVKPGVTLTKSSFNGNGASGLAIASKGPVTLTSLSADNNFVNGVTILTDGNVLIQGGSATNNQGYGIEVTTPGNLTISGTTANFNWHGFHLAGIGGNVLLSNLTARRNRNYGAGVHMDGEGKTLTVTRSVFNENVDGGLSAITLGPILISGVSADGNDTVDSDHADDDYGLYLNNLDAAVPSAVTVNGASGGNSFDRNTTGLGIISKGPVSVSAFSADWNLKYGVHVDTCVFEDPECTASGSVQVSFGTANDNGEIGLVVMGGGTIKIKNVDAIYNGRVVEGEDPEDGYGLYLLSDGDVSISQSNIYANWRNGIRLYQDSGILTLSAVVYFGNDRSGEGYSDVWVD